MFRTADGVKVHAWMSTFWMSTRARLREGEQQSTAYVEVIVTEKWGDLLDFQKVPLEEAVARVNDAGFFILRSGEIYKAEPDDGAVTLQNRTGLAKTFAGRRARCKNGRAISASLAWLRSPNRREYKSIGYWPGNHGRPAKSCNLWQGWGIGAKPGDWSIIGNYVLHLVGGDRDKANFILDWCAHLVQRPWEKPGVALVFTGRNGAGENLLAKVLAAVIGQRNVLITANGKKIFEKFNWNTAGKLLIVAEAFAANAQELNRLKWFLTSDEIRVDPRYGSTITMKSRHRVLITLSRDQINAARNDGCRLVVCHVSDNWGGGNAYFDPLWKAVRGQNDALLAAFMHELRTRDIANWKPDEAARKLGTLARQNVLALDPPIIWLTEQASTATKDGAAGVVDMTPGTWSLLRERSEMLESYRTWARDNRVQGSCDYTTPETFHPTLRQFLNQKTFPGPKLEGKSGPMRYWCMPTRQEMNEGLNRLLGGKVIDG